MLILQLFRVSKMPGFAGFAASSHGSQLYVASPRTIDPGLGARVFAGIDGDRRAKLLATSELRG